MKKLIYSFSLMVVLSTLFACNNNDAPAIEEKPLPVYSYFRGYLNNEYINIEHRHASYCYRRSSMVCYEIHKYGSRKEAQEK